MWVRPRSEEVPVLAVCRHKTLGGEPADRLRCRREWQPHSRPRGENQNERAHYMSRNQALQALLPLGLDYTSAAGVCVFAQPDLAGRIRPAREGGGR